MGVQAEKSPTLVQVARLAGVSLTTASKAVNNHGRISEDTRARVLSAAAMLRYTPNHFARSLITGRSGTVGIILFGSATERFAVPIMLGAERALAEIELALIVADAGSETARIRDMVEVFTARKVDGIIVIGDNNHVTPSVTASSPTPVVYAYGVSDDPADRTHLVDDELGGRLMTAHLLETGRRRIAHVTGPRDSTSVIQRLRGVRAVLHDHDRRLVGPVRHGAWTQRHGHAAAVKLFTAHPDLDAVLCGSDQIASGVVQAARATGRRVPEDLAVTGFDNWAPFAVDADPPLTTVEPNLAGVGNAAAGDLSAVIAGRAPAGLDHRYPPRLVLRQSS